MAPALFVRPGRWHSSRLVDLHPAAIIKSRALEARLFCLISNLRGQVSNSSWKFYGKMIILITGSLLLLAVRPLIIMSDMEFIEVFLWKSARFVRS